MRQLATFLLIALVLPATAAETWRWKDANGVVHYSDRPVPGAERMNLGPVASTSSQPAAPRANVVPVQQVPAPITYSGCIVAVPASDQVFNSVRTVSVSLLITPALDEEHRLQVLLDGRIYTGWPERAMNFTLENMFRGSHTVSVRVLNAEGRTVCAGPATTFHVRQPSIFSPARQPAPRP